MLTGLASVRGKVIVFMDGDGQDEPFDLPLLVEVVMAGADLAIGSRFLERESTIGGQGISPGAITKINEFGNRMLTRLINSVLGVRLTDTQSGYKCMRVERLLALRLSADRYEIETEILVRAIRSGMTVREVPVRRHPRQHGESKLYGPRFGRIVFGLRVLRVLEREVWGDRSL
jgi:glycosyltransferase involved in cell wall biosynthesis